MRRIALMTLASMALVACGGTSVTGDAGTAGDAAVDMDTLETFLADAASRRCAGAIACMASEVQLAQAFGTQAHCEAAVLDELESGEITIAEGARQGQILFDPSDADACLAAIERQGCEEALTIPVSDFPWPAECASVIRGTLEPGSQCEIDEQCRDGGCGCGTCHAYAAEDESCDGVPCGPGLSCREGTCAPVSHAGDACTQFGPEDVNGTCAPNLPCVDGTCHVPTEYRTAREGETCYSPYEWSDPRVWCAAGLDCFFETLGAGRCVGPQGANEPCDGSETGLCGEGLLCQGPAYDLRCLPYLDEGAECSPSGWGDPCGPGMVCALRDSMCRRLADNGASCTSDFDCISGYCDEDTCAESPDRYCE